MRILHVISTLAPSSGGTTEVVKGLATAQAEAGHEITVCTTNSSGTHTEKTLSNSYIESLFPASVSLRIFPVLISPMLYSPAMGRWIRNSIHEFDIVHVHTLYRYPPTYAAYQARLQNIPYIICPHGSLDPFLYSKSTKSVALKRIYEKLFDLPNLNRADAIHFTAEEERLRVSYLGLRSPSFVVPNGIDWDRYKVLPVRGSLRKKWGLLDQRVVLFLGRLHFKKGLDLLIEGFDLVQQRMSDVHLVIAGPENDEYADKVRSWVKQRNIEDKVHFVGPLAGADVVQAYVDADLFVLPSYTENFGLTVAEAMASELPVVISNQVNIHDEVRAAGAGIVIKCEANELASAIRTMLTDPTSPRNFGVAGRKLVEEKFCWPRIVEILDREYCKIFERHFRSDEAK